MSAFIDSGWAGFVLLTPLAIGLGIALGTLARHVADRRRS